MYAIKGWNIGEGPPAKDSPTLKLVREFLILKSKRK